MLSKNSFRALHIQFLRPSFQHMQPKMATKIQICQRHVWQVSTKNWIVFTDLNCDSTYSVLRLTLQWTTENTTSHRSQSNAVQVSLDLRIGCRDAYSHACDTFTVLDWLGRPIASTVVQRKVKRSTAESNGQRRSNTSFFFFELGLVGVWGILNLIPERRFVFVRLESTHFLALIVAETQCLHGTSVT